MGGSVSEVVPSDDSPDREVPEAPPGYRLYEYHDPFEDWVGPLWLNREGEHLKFAFPAMAKHCNTGGTVHGGMLMTFADFALCAIACGELIEQERCVTVSFNSEFVAAGRLGDLIEAEGEIVRRSRTLTFVRGQVFSGDKTLLNFSGVTRRFERR